MREVIAIFWTINDPSTLQGLIKFFRNNLEDMQKLSEEVGKLGMKIGDEKLSMLLLTNDVIIFTDNLEDMQRILSRSK